MEIIRFECGCGKRIKVAAHFAGQDGRCPACGAGFVVPNPPTVSVAQPMISSPDEVHVLQFDDDELNGLSNAVMQHPPEWHNHSAYAGAPPRAKSPAPARQAAIPLEIPRPVRQPSASPNARIDQPNRPKPASIPFARLLGRAVGGSLFGWIATVIFGIIWLEISRNAQPYSVSLVISACVVCFAAVYLLAAPVRRLVDGILGNIQTGLKFAPVRILVICGLSLLITGPQVVGRIKHGAQGARPDVDATETHAKDSSLDTESVASSRGGNGSSTDNGPAFTYEAVADRLAALPELQGAEKSVLRDQRVSDQQGRGKPVGTVWGDSAPQRRGLSGHVPGLYGAQVFERGLLVSFLLTPEEIFSSPNYIRENPRVIRLAAIIETVAGGTKSNNEILDLIVVSFQKRSHGGIMSNLDFDICGRKANLGTALQEQDPASVDAWMHGLYGVNFSMNY